MGISSGDLEAGIRKLSLGRDTPVVVHTSLSAFGWLDGGADAFVDALLSSFSTLLMPAFTYQTMIIPEYGPAANGLLYGSGRHSNRMARFFRPDMPVDRLIGVVPESLRKRRQARRSAHPVLSFVGVGAGKYLERQSLQAPLGPLESLSESGGWVLLMGVDHSANTSLHLAERNAGWPRFTRWALTPSGIRRLGSFPGCSNGFNALGPSLKTITRQVEVGTGRILGLPLDEMIATATIRMKQKPAAYLCSRLDCGLCMAVRSALLVPVF